MTRTRILLIALLALAGLAGPAAAAPRLVPQGWLGVTADGPFDPGDAGEWNRMARSGVETVRVAFRWYLIEPAPGRLDLARTDRIVAAAARRGMAVLPVIENVPPWAATRPGDLAAPPRDPATLGAFSAALVRRYGPRGSFWRDNSRGPRRPIHAWQVLNEPNILGHWSEQPPMPAYVAALRGAAAGIRGADPRATIVLAGLSNESWTALEQIYAAGARGLFDAVAVHPYTRRPVDVLRILRLVRGVMAANGDAALPLWVTELSWPAAQGRPGWKVGIEVGERRQARMLAIAMRKLYRSRRNLKLERVLWYTWISNEVGPSAFDWSGLRRTRPGGTVSMPALKVFRQAARRLRGCAGSARAARCG